MKRNTRLTRTILGTSLLASCSLALGASATAGDISGVVIGPDGRPASGVNVVIDDLLKGAQTDRDGTYQIEDVVPGEHEIRFSSWTLATTDLQVTVPEQGDLDEANVTMGANLALQRAAQAYVAPEPAHLAQKHAFLSSLTAAPDRQQPNIVVILFDDLGFGDLSSFGNQLIDTPHIDGWGREGMTLTSFYSASPVCTPSRAGLLTGRYPTRSHAANHVFFPVEHFMATIRAAYGYANALPRDEILIPEMLGRFGYVTGAFGKWHLGDPLGHRPNDFGFDRYYGVLHSNDMLPLDMWSDREVAIETAENGQADLTRRFTDEAIAFIRDNRDGPFFAYIPYTAPHLPHVPPEERRGTSEGGTYGDVIEDLDANVGRIRTTLEELGIAEDTLVIITSDNGGDWGGSAGELRGRKGQTWEGGQRVPAFVIWPGRIEAGSTNDSMAMNIDLLPTFASIVGLELPQDRIIDGRSMASILWGDGSAAHDYLYYVTNMSGEYQAVRDADYKYRDVISQQSPFNPTGDTEFYAATPSLYAFDGDHEAHDVSARHPEVRERLQQALTAWRLMIETNPRGWLTQAD